MDKNTALFTLNMLKSSIIIIETVEGNSGVRADNINTLLTPAGAVNLMLKTVELDICQILLYNSAF